MHERNTLEQQKTLKISISQVSKNDGTEHFSLIFELTFNLVPCSSSSCLNDQANIA